MVKVKVNINEFETISGRGYFTENGNGKIVGKYIHPVGKHPIKNGYTAHDVATIDEFNSIIVDDIRTESELINELIGQQTRNGAIDTLVAAGKLIKANGELRLA